MKDNASAVRAIADVARSAMEKHNGKAPIADVIETLRDLATAREWATWCERNIAAQVRSALRSKSPSHGLPEHYAIGGEYVALTLFSPEQYKAKAEELARLSVANADKVRALASACKSAHGHTFDANEVLRRAAS